jgi:hypothetical protein
MNVFWYHHKDSRDWNVISLCINKRLMQCLLHVSCSEFIGTPLEAALQQLAATCSSIKTPFIWWNVNFGRAQLDKECCIPWSFGMWCITQHFILNVSLASLHDERFPAHECYCYRLMAIGTRISTWGLPAQHTKELYTELTYTVSYQTEKPFNYTNIKMLILQSIPKLLINLNHADK